MYAKSPLAGTNCRWSRWAGIIALCTATSCTGWLTAPVRGADIPHPFPRQVPALAFPEDLEWMNTSRAYTLEDFRGRFLILDFWTYCCINCMHVLPELKKLEQKYEKELAVVGVHSAKFETEKDRKNIEDAILRYEIDHPVINDANHAIWNAYGVRSWPTILLIDPLGQVVYYQSGEFRFEELDRILASALPYYRQQKVLVNEPLGNKRLAESVPATPLRYPGKILADESGGRLFIADSNHNRIVMTTLDGQLLEVIGSGEIGRRDGDFSTATFNHPQGMALHEETLYVADTENHLLRKVSLTDKSVTTIAGVGVQSRSGWPGLENVRSASDLPKRWSGPPLKTALNSPWALWVHDSDLYIAMAGPHQIWKMPLRGNEIGPYAGNGREDIVDGPLLPRVPYELGYSSFAQPSGLASDGEQLFVADSEGSSIRSVPFDPDGDVTTVVGTSHLPANRLFTFGDVDGPVAAVRLQHPLGVVYHDGKLFIADTYNNKIKAIDLAQQTLTTVAGTGQPGSKDDPPLFDEPAGISYAAGQLYVADTNNHAIRVIDLQQDGRVRTLEIAGLAPAGSAAAVETSAAPPKKKKPSFPGAIKRQLPETVVQPVDGKVQMVLDLKLPNGWKMNPDAPMGYLIEVKGETGVVDRKAVGEYVKPQKPAAKIEVSLPVSGTGKEVVTVSLNYYYCEVAGMGICKTGAVIWTVPLEISQQATSGQAVLKHQIDPGT